MREEGDPQKSGLIGSEVITCECGKDDMACIREGLVIELLDEDYEATHYPWRY